jgi:RimJ/RimL family protein N-acetyltransferase
MTTTGLHFIRFELAHMPLYAAWTGEGDGLRWLGAPTQEWLDYVLTTRNSLTWMVLDGARPVGHVQVDLLEDDPSQAQVSLVIAPDARRRGYARRILAALPGVPAHDHIERYYGFVHHDNAASRAMLDACGWRQLSPAPDDQGMLEYEWCITS